jgi:hypothetical protein
MGGRLPTLRLMAVPAGALWSNELEFLPPIQDLAGWYVRQGTERTCISAYQRIDEAMIRRHASTTKAFLDVFPVDRLPAVTDRHVKRLFAELCKKPRDSTGSTPKKSFKIRNGMLAPTEI